MRKKINKSKLWILFLFVAGAVVVWNEIIHLRVLSILGMISVATTYIVDEVEDE